MTEERERRATAERAMDEVLERTKLRCKAVIDRINSLLSPPKPSSSFNNSCYRTLLRLAHAELSFLSRSSPPDNNPSPSFPSLSSNVSHLEAVLHILQQPFVHGVSRVCKPVPVSGLLENAQKCKSNVYVDIVCSLKGKPVWFIVSARNPKYVFWEKPCGAKSKSLQTRIRQVVDAAARSSPATKPSSVILFFSNGLSKSICQKLAVEFEASKMDLDFTDCDIFSGELDGDWVYVFSRSYGQACVYEIMINCSQKATRNVECEVKDSLLGALSPRGAIVEEIIGLNLGATFCQLISKMRLPQVDAKGAEFSLQNDLPGEADMINFDTTALIAIISGISNGCAENLLVKSNSELTQRFKGNAEFVIAQVMSEIQNPIHADLEEVLSGKRGIVCESVVSEFKELVSMCGGPNEKSRADHLLKCLVAVPDMPSLRMMSLPTSRKVALKNKVVFGTGDKLRAPTLTANTAFVRAVSQTGMSLSTVHHRPRALTGD